MWRIDDPQSNEASKVRLDVVRFTRGRGLDIGCGPYKAFPHFIGVDNGHHWGVAGADIVAEADDLSMFGSESMDFVFSSHLLEHIKDTKKTLREWWRVIRPGGYLVLYLPHKDFYPRQGQPGANPDHKHDFGPNDISKAMAEVVNKASFEDKHLGQFDLAVNEVRDHDNGAGELGNEYSFLQVYQKIEGNYPEFSYKKERPKKTVAVIRYGGIGDCIQVSAGLPGLKALGYHITMITTPKGEEVLRHDPNIDDWWIQDVNQVPPGEIVAYWYRLEKYFDRVINLSESVEGTLLAIHDRVQHNWPKALRHKLMDVNYIDRLQDICDVPRDHTLAVWHASDDELVSAIALRDKFMKESGCTKLVMWCLSGSSRHKINPYMDIIFSRIFSTYRDVAVVTVGDESCQVLEMGWRDTKAGKSEPRCFATSGELGVRATLALARVCDVVVGPETGTMNSVAMMPVKKVLMLSHSTNENLSRDWENTIVLTPSCHCYPCHKMHYGRGDCDYVKIPEQYQGVIDEGDMPLCVADMNPDFIWRAIKHQLDEKESEAA